jgi:hypothetical protein
MLRASLTSGRGLRTLVECSIRCGCSSCTARLPFGQQRELRKPTLAGDRRSSRKTGRRIAIHCRAEPRGMIRTGSRDAVIAEVTRLLVPPGDPDAICEAVLGLLRDPDRCRRMSTAARRWVVENYEDRRVLGMAVAFLSEPDQALPVRRGLKRKKSGLRGLLVCRVRSDFRRDRSSGRGLQGVRSSFARVQDIRWGNSENERSANCK